jgi:hypothetical protein
MEGLNSKSTVKQPEWFPPSEATGQYLGITFDSILKGHFLNGLMF